MTNDKLATINIANKIRNTSLSRKQGLMPLFELVSNSMHSILERKEAGLLDNTEQGTIIITLIRNGIPETLASIKDNDSYPIQSIIVEDNGIGLNDENLVSFTEADSDHKLNIGGKGIGRFVCLKAFKWIDVESTFKVGEEFKKRKIELRNSKIGFEHYEEVLPEKNEFKTVFTLHGFEPIYEKHTVRTITEIANAIITHFQLYFITNSIPHIIIRNQNNDQVDLNYRYNQTFQHKVQKGSFEIGEYKFDLFLSKSNSAQSHRLHYCAHNRSVINEWLGKNIIEFGKNSISTSEGQSFYYAAFVVSNTLDESVNNERTNFTFPENDEDNETSEEITLSKIRKGAITLIENLANDYIECVRNQKIETYRSIVNSDLPQYRSVINKRSDQVKKLTSGLSNHDLDIELYKIEANWKAEIKQKGTDIIDKKKDITTQEEYNKLYEDYLSELNEVGQSELARYIIHRKSVIDLLDVLLSKGEDNSKYSNEDLVHSVFFPIRTTSDEVPYDKQNLWLIDERLSYHSYLSSDKQFSTIEPLTVSENPNDRPDLLIFSNAFAFATEKNAPYNSITIVEFKKPERDNYIDNDEKKNPLDQVERYVEDLLGGTIKNRKGRTINITKDTPFYIYIVCDLTPSLIKILERRDFIPTPDGLGYYTIKSRRYNAYIEVSSFEKIRADARKRNQILFDKLGLPID